MGMVVAIGGGVRHRCQSPCPLGYVLMAIAVSVPLERAQDKCSFVDNSYSKRPDTQQRDTLWPPFLHVLCDSGNAQHLLVVGADFFEALHRIIAMHPLHFVHQIKQQNVSVRPL